MPRTTQPMPASAGQSPEPDPSSKNAESRPDLVRRLAEARAARQKVLQDRDPRRPISLTEADLLRRASENSLPHLGAAISKSSSAQLDLPSLAPQEEIDPRASDKTRHSILFLLGIVLFALLVMVAVAVGTVAFLGGGFPLGLQDLVSRLPLS